MEGACQETILHIIQSRRHWTRPYAIIAHPDREDVAISWRRLDNAVNRAARFLDRAIPQHETVFAWMGQADLRCLIWAFAALKTGKTVS